MKNILFSFISFTIALNFANAQEVNKDSLFLKYDKLYFKTFDKNPDYLFFKQGFGVGGGTLFFVKKEVIDNLKSKKVVSFKKFISKCPFYDKKKRKITNYHLFMKYISTFEVFVVQKSNHQKKVIKLNIAFQIS